MHINALLVMSSQRKSGSHALLQRTLGPALNRPTPGPRPSTCRSTDLYMPSRHGVGTQIPTCAIAEYGTGSGLVHPKASPQSTVLFGSWPGWGAKWRFFSSGSRWDLNLSTHHPLSNALTSRPYCYQTHTHTNICTQTHCIILLALWFSL